MEVEYKAYRWIGDLTIDVAIPAGAVGAFDPRPVQVQLDDAIIKTIRAILDGMGICNVVTVYLSTEAGENGGPPRTLND